jgi:hypothetical protein
VVEDRMNIIDLLKEYDGLITAMASIILAFITLLYLRETRLQRLVNEKLVMNDNCELNISPKIKLGEDNKENIDFDIEIENFGSKPAFYVEFKVLTKRSPKECISQIIAMGTKEDFYKSDSFTWTKTTNSIMPGIKLNFFCRVLPKFLDYDQSFYLWVRYHDFYKNQKDEILHISLSDTKSIRITYINNLPSKSREKVDLPVSYR